jgi:multisubunit Na+/H+ antiporter MnhE subunit
MENIIINLNNGWYDFSKLDQSNNYIKIHALNCQTDRKAINRARKIIKDKKAIITIKER